MTDRNQYEGPNAFGEFMDEFMNESDRACIILASAEIETRLEFLFHKLLKTNASLRKDLFGFTGPLGSFSARVKMAYALGLIDKGFYDLLELFRSLRNKIVHKGRKASLADHELSKISDKILSEFRKSSKFSKWACSVEGFTQDQYQFRYAIAYMIVMIEHTTFKLKPLNTTPHSCNPEMHISDNYT